MKYPIIRLLPIATLFALSACGSVFAPASSSKPEAAAKPVVNASAYQNQDCLAQANSKLKMFDRPDTYPISGEERNNARDALYSECMKGQQNQIAGVYKSDTQQPGMQTDTTSLANLSPAAGGNMPRGNVMTNSYPGATVVTVQGNDASQLAGLSPSAGGNIASAYPGATVVVVQSPTANAPLPRPAPVMPQALARPIAVEAQKPVTVANVSNDPNTANTPVAPSPQTAAPKPAYTAPTASTLYVQPPAASNGNQQLEQILTK